MTRKLTYVAVLGLFAQQAGAVTWYDVDSSKILSIRADGRSGYEGYYISYTQLFPGDDGCTARDFAYIRKNDSLAKDMYSTALAAYLAGRTITIGTTGCDSGGNVIQSLAMKPL